MISFLQVFLTFSVGNFNHQIKKISVCTTNAYTSIRDKDLVITRLSCKENKGSEGTMIHRYEIEFSVMYGGKVSNLQSTIIPASSLEEANEKLQSEVRRRLGTCRVKIDTASVCSSEDSRYIIEPK